MNSGFDEVFASVAFLSVYSFIDKLELRMKTEYMVFFNQYIHLHCIFMPWQGQTGRRRHCVLVCLSYHSLLRLFVCLL